ncbi:hypothetical protein [uncultured Dokdonia sp.]|uniref:hypothetical protein n=1 Tax=uncultured Dokdonia sp. TaxID=575653 RepID=UPI002628F2AD|nr:hypothetical protein [uncultured Dokdonia sp.]
MLESISKLGTVLSKENQKFIQGGSNRGWCNHACPSVGGSCTINGRSGTCKEVYCDSSPTRLCVAPLSADHK